MFTPSRFTQQTRKYNSIDNISVPSIHGNKEQSQRKEAIQSFKTSRTRILVSNIVSVRGNDISNIQHIINFDFPNDIYVYRECIGRINRYTGDSEWTISVNLKLT
ncbi:unnamed protein product [Adineta ricciae]|uniref:Helicase C-terminal domain-containing protein n=1 Tax=Adineta ricciae TaxID=249248 RepID=A0A815RNN1_ADIRI|nr:unnamed protein product [Adineta ricciae]